MAEFDLTPARSEEITDTDLAMMERALKLAQEAGEAGEVPVAAVVYRGETVVSEAVNARESTSGPLAGGG